MLFLYINSVPRDECFHEAHFEQNQENRDVVSVDSLEISGLLSSNLFWIVTCIIRLIQTEQLLPEPLPPNIQTG